MIITKELRASIRSRREPTVEIDGARVPGSIPFIRGILATTDDALDRDELLVELAGEYLRADLDDEHLLVQRERVANQPDAAVTWLGLSHSLSMRKDGGEEAKRAAENAVQISRACGALIRYSLQCLADVARKTGDAELYQRALGDLIADAANHREDDSVLDERVVADLPDGFCPPELEAQYRDLLEPTDEDESPLNGSV
jgi:hypothetical protein